MEKKPRKPKTPSIKEHLTDQGFPDAHKLKSIPFDPNGINTFTDKDGTTYKWKVGENPIPSILRNDKNWQEAIMGTDSYEIIDMKPLPENEIERMTPLEILEQYRKRSDEDAPSLRHLSYEQQLNLPDNTTLHI